MAQIDKNTVDSKNQLKNQFVFIHNKEKADLKIMFVGNSITLHGVKKDIGWNNAWGMAASSEEKDYVHCVIRELEKDNINTSFCICQVAVWETEYQNGSEILDTYFEYARNFDADIIVMRCVENCPHNDFDAVAFEKEYKKLINYLNLNDRAKLILSTGFWKHPGDEIIAKTADNMNCPCVFLGDLGEDDSMKAVGLFEHSGVANHPGDIGMKVIAERLISEIKNIL